MDQDEGQQLLEVFTNIQPLLTRQAPSDDERPNGTKKHKAQHPLHLQHPPNAQIPPLMQLLTQMTKVILHHDQALEADRRADTYIFYLLPDSRN